ncbi:ParB family protein [Vibrio sagamiensis]|uniref:Peptide transporter n=1 Tax=Vibrio sagamiensis NBRC 104589 TaxID=1219064 RepID=A0A511QKD5_9VIBR|nr:ParB family protein [Vibrio sagamiensis]PNQ71071.1 chromosome partitioning protein ParB [Vibrio agarivorans]PNQ71084.1 chromosome partitioning protein ParB [Vibrio agarivorans]GEM77506.1 peptide transporter [Vibrio sagamiensis NBRC 104589]
MLRPQDKRTSFQQGNQLNKRNDSDAVKKTFTFASGKQVAATRVLVKASEIATKTAIHVLNPRRQASLSLEAVRDILPTIESEGVHTEGVAIKDKQGKYQLLDSSRRRFCCLQAQKDLPLWVIEANVDNSDLIAYIKTTQSVKKLSYRELGSDYALLMEQNGFKKLDELAEFLNLGRETCRKRFAAAGINQILIDVFPDCEGIPNNYYAKLAKVEKQLVKRGLKLESFIKSLDKVEVGQGSSVEDAQKRVLANMESKAQGKVEKATWTTQALAEFSNKNTYAKVSRSSDQRQLKIELSRLSPDIYEDIIAYVSDKVKADSK